MPVPFRAGSPGVINMKKLNEALLARSRGEHGQPGDCRREFAMQMLRFPLRQVFGDTAVAQDADAFVATVKIDVLTERFDARRPRCWSHERRSTPTRSARPR